jgi:hypothetical protein
VADIERGTPQSGGKHQDGVMLFRTRSEKYSSKLGISRSFIRIFEINPEDTFTRCEKFSSKLDISRSFIRIFASGSNKIQIL